MASVTTTDEADIDHGERADSHDPVKKAQSCQSPLITFTCDICLSVFGRKSNWKRHRALHDSGVEYPCPRECGLRFVNRATRGLHFQRAHKNDAEKGDSGPPFECRVCGKDFARLYNRNQHEKLHTGDAEHMCTECGKLFPTGYALKSHKESHLDAELRKTVLCDVCGKNYLSKSALDEHKRRHLGDKGKDHICDICGSRFYRLAHLKQHMDVHAKTSTDQYLCENCHKFYPTKRLLDSHRRTVHVQPENLLPCLLCGKTFKTSSDLKRHHKIHSGVKEHVCTYCDRAFTQKENLKTHIRTHTGEKPYRCQYCAVGFAQSQHLKSHLRSSHGGEEKAALRCRRTFSYDELNDIDLEIGLSDGVSSMHFSLIGSSYGFVSPR